MVRLSPTSGNPPLGYTWQRDTGWRVVVVIDDYYDIFEFASSDQPVKSLSAHAYGLSELFSELPKLESTRAIGFFSLPDPTIPSYEQDIQAVIDTIFQWLSTFRENNCRCYGLIDYFYGQGFERTRLSGISFLKKWQEIEAESAANLSILPAKLAYLSIGGEQEPTPLKVFKKSNILNEVQTYANLPAEIRAWLDIDEHPLSRLWRESTNWFVAGRNDDDVMKHTTANIQDYLKNHESGELAAYRWNVESTLGILLPESWWQQPEAVGAIHESLKCFCGAMFCGQCDADTLKRNISTGAAFMIALMAHQNLYGNIDPFVQNEAIWSDCDRLATSFIFARQDCQTAKNAAIALYDYFRLLFEIRNRADASSAARTSQVNGVLFYDGGRLFRIELAWNAHRKATHGVESLAERTTKLLRDTPIRIPEASPRNTREAAMKLWALMGASEDGCFAPGVVCLSENILTVGSVM